MGINLGGNSGVGTQNGALLNMKKNDVLDLTKRNPGLKKVDLGAGWDISSYGADFDLDISAVMVQANGKIRNVSDVVYFNNMEVNGVRLNGDNRTGAGDGDDEVISVDLSMIDRDIHKIIFVVTIYDAQSKRQTFGMVENSYVRLVDVANGERELCRFDLKTNGSTATAVEFAELYRDGSEWQFKAIGEGKIADLNGILSKYM